MLGIPAGEKLEDHTNYVSVILTDVATLFYVIHNISVVMIVSLSGCIKDQVIVINIWQDLSCSAVTFTWTLAGLALSRHHQLHGLHSSLYTYKRGRKSLNGFYQFSIWKFWTNPNWVVSISTSKQLLILTESLISVHNIMSGESRGLSKYVILMWNLVSQRNTILVPL